MKKLLIAGVLGFGLVAVQHQSITIKLYRKISVSRLLGL